MTDVVVVLTTIGVADAAEPIASRLIEERLAACVNVTAEMESFYRWNGRVEHARERQLVIKTTRDRLPALQSRLHELHPYEIPEFLVLTVDQGSDAYMRWVEMESRSEQ